MASATAAASVMSPGATSTSPGSMPNGPRIGATSLGPPGQDAHLVAGAHKCGYRVRPDEPRRAGHQHPHAQRRLNSKSAPVLTLVSVTSAASGAGAASASMVTRHARSPDTLDTCAADRRRWRSRSSAGCTPSWAAINAGHAMSSPSRNASHSPPATRRLRRRRRRRANRRTTGAERRGATRRRQPCRNRGGPAGARRDTGDTGQLLVTDRHRLVDSVAIGDGSHERPGQQMALQASPVKSPRSSASRSSVARPRSSSASIASACRYAPRFDAWPTDPPARGARRMKPRAPDESGDVDRDGVRIHWDRYGDGDTTVVLLRRGRCSPSTTGSSRCRSSPAGSGRSPSRVVAADGPASRPVRTRTPSTRTSATSSPCSTPPARTGRYSPGCPAARCGRSRPPPPGPPE